MRHRLAEGVAGRGLGVAVGVASAIVATAALDGGYPATSWGWLTLAFLWLAAVSPLAGALGPGRLGVVTLAALLALGGWQLVSGAWTRSIPLTVLEPQRTLLYAALLLAVLVWAGTREVRWLLRGVVGGCTVVASWNLLVRGGAGSDTGASAAPLGYANGMGLLAATGLAVAIGLVVARTTGVRERLVIGAAGVVCAAALVASGSRGAAIALLLALPVPLALRAPRATAVLLAAATAAVAIGIGAAAVASSERRSYWSAALAAWVDSPGGTGAGTWERSWLLRRPEALPARDAHSLYVETLSETGPIGLALLAVAVAAPLVAAARRRQHPFVVPALLGTVVLVVHLGLDWGWELPGAVVPGAACAGALLATAPRARAPGAAVVATCVAIAVPVVAVLPGHVLTARAGDALRRGDALGAVSDAERARALHPWAAEPLRLAGEADRALGRRAEAREAFRRALARDASDPELWRALARVSAGAERSRALACARERDPLGGPGPPADPPYRVESGTCTSR